MNPFATYAMMRAIVAGTEAPLAPSWSAPLARHSVLTQLPSKLTHANSQTLNHRVSIGLTFNVQEQLKLMLMHMYTQ